MDGRDEDGSEALSADASGAEKKKEGGCNIGVKGSGGTEQPACEATAA